MQKEHLAAAGVPADLVEKAQALGVSLTGLLGLIVKHGPQAIGILQEILGMLGQEPPA